MDFLKKFFTFLIIIVFLTLCYINQQSAIVKLNYRITKNREIINSVLDRNGHLMYNNSVKKSPQNIQTALYKRNINFDMPKEDQIVYLVNAEIHQKKQKEIARKNLFAFFGISSKAEAKSIQK